MPDRCSLRSLRMRLMLVLPLLAVALIATSRPADRYQEDAERLAPLLHWHAGSVVADVGAGEGEMTLIAAKQVGVTGRVYATELDPQKLAHLQELAAKESNITVLKAGIAQTNLPRDCCDSIYLRLVYHHLTQPAEVDASLLKSLKPGGLLAVIDEEPQPGTRPVAGVPENRIGHGVPEKVMIEELIGTGFQVVKTFDRWPIRHYCVVFRKPTS